MKNLFDIINVSGSDRVAFLQGQLTQNIALLCSSNIHFGALCSPKGRVIASCQLFATKETIHIILPSQMTDIVMQRLNLYKLRSDVFLEKNNNAHSFCVQQQDNKSTVKNNDYLENSYVSRYLEKTSHREFFNYLNDSKSMIKASETHLNREQWQTARIANGIVDIVPEISEKYTPHMLNLDTLNGVSFNKGCYVGQEIVARTEYIGKVKRRAVIYSLSKKISSRHEPLFLGKDKVAIDILSTSENMLIALVNTSFAADNLIYAGGTASPINLK